MGEDKGIKRISDPVYVVTRNGRRVEAENYLSRAEANERMRQLILMVKEWDSNRENEIDVVRTTAPHRVR